MYIAPAAPCVEAARHRYDAPTHPAPPTVFDESTLSREMNDPCPTTGIVITGVREAASQEPSDVKRYALQRWRGNATDCIIAHIHTHERCPPAMPRVRPHVAHYCRTDRVRITTVWFINGPVNVNARIACHYMYQTDAHVCDNTGDLGVVCMESVCSADHGCTHC